MGERRRCREGGEEEMWGRGRGGDVGMGERRRCREGGGEEM